MKKHKLRNDIANITSSLYERLRLSVPIDSMKVAGLLQVRCIATNVESTNLTYDAILTKDPAILYDETLNTTQLQFPIARELGRLYFITNDISYNDYIINEFAASLLMPQEIFIDYCLSNIDDSGQISLTAISNYFNVLKHTANTRGKVLGLWQ